MLRPGRKWKWKNPVMYPHRWFHNVYTTKSLMSDIRTKCLTHQLKLYFVWQRHFCRTLETRWSSWSWPHFNPNHVQRQPGSSSVSFMTLYLFEMMVIIGLVKTRADLRIASMLMFVLRDYSNWILVVISTERFLCIFRPLTVKNCCHKRCVIVVLVTMFCTLVGLSVFFASL